MFTNNWFQTRVREWEQFVIPLQPKRFLEIGSYEGQSVKWVLDQFPDCSAVCIDTWENEGQGVGNHDDICKAEKNFQMNMKDYGARVQAIKSQSAKALKNIDEQFDLIYIDGSHYATNVIEDAILCFALLRKHGLLIFDDYSWRGYEEEWKNPRLAIDAFLSIYRDEINIIYVGDQVFLLKMS